MSNTTFSWFPEVLKMHEANEITDGFFRIRQEMESKRIYLYKYGEVVRTIQPGRLLSLDELRETLIKERTQMFTEGM